jgi:hypothetical protein
LTIFTTEGVLVALVHDNSKLLRAKNNIEESKREIITT